MCRSSKPRLRRLAAKNLTNGPHNPVSPSPSWPDRKVGPLLSSAVALRAPLVQVAVVVVANVVAVGAVSRSPSNQIRLKVSHVTHTLSGRRDRRDRAAATGRVARISNGIRRAAIAAETEQFSKEHR